MQDTDLENALANAGITKYRYYPSIGSTNDEALAWVDKVASEWSLVIADEQTRGKGRFNRRWITAAGSSLAFSLILKPLASELPVLSLFAPLCGLAVHSALQKHFALEAEIKWPNDLLIRRKKCCGILVEAVWTNETASALVLGIGINVAPGSVPPADNLQFPATCLETELGQKIDRTLLLQQVLEQIRLWRPRLGTPEFFTYWQSHLAFIGEPVMIVQSEKQSIIGIEKGINDQGHLVLLLDNHQEAAFEVGDVHLRPLTASGTTGGTHA